MSGVRSKSETFVHEMMVAYFDLFNDSKSYYRNNFLKFKLERNVKH